MVAIRSIRVFTTSGVDNERKIALQGPADRLSQNGRRLSLIECAKYSRQLPRLAPMREIVQS